MIAAIKKSWDDHWDKLFYFLVALMLIGLVQQWVFPTKAQQIEKLDQENDDLVIKYRNIKAQNEKQIADIRTQVLENELKIQKLQNEMRAQ